MGRFMRTRLPVRAAALRIMAMAAALVRNRNHRYRTATHATIPLDSSAAHFVTRRAYQCRSASYSSAY
jgi:hypothetical protein